MIRGRRLRIGWLATCAALCTGCASTFAFYENSKIALTMSVDPQAPDPVEVTAAFKETVFALVPLKETSDGTSQDKKRFEAGSVLSDFDVRYLPLSLTATVNHGLATGAAAGLLAARTPDEILARKIVIIGFVRSLATTDVPKVADALKLAGLGTQPVELVRSRVLLTVRQAAPAVVDDIETQIKATFPAFTPWKPAP